MTSETYRVEIQPGRMTTAKASLPGKAAGTGVVLAHGMNNNLDQSLLVSVCEHLAERGRAAVRFNFLYREEGNATADANDVLLETFATVYRDAARRFDLKPESMVMGGKSLGARVSARIAGNGEPSAALVYLGFPLHSPGQPEKTRKDLILEAARIPQLFIAGTRDPLCPMDGLRQVLTELGGRYGLYVVEGGNHSFQIEGGGAGAEERINSEIARAVGDWLDEIVPIPSS